MSFYSSRESSRPGIGYPSCNRALCLRSRNQNDPNGYYAELGVYPWSSDNEIRSALRRAFRRFHPDGTDPDEERFIRFQEIAEVLQSPGLKKRYDSSPSGQVFVDSEVRAAMDLVGIPLDALEPFTEEAAVDTYLDYFSIDEDQSDVVVSQQWYEHFVSTAPLVSYTRPIRVLLWDNANTRWLPISGMMCIPRKWCPSTELAFALLTVHL